MFNAVVESGSETSRSYSKGNFGGSSSLSLGIPQLDEGFQLGVIVLEVLQQSQDALALTMNSGIVQACFSIERIDFLHVRLPVQEQMHTGSVSVATCQHQRRHSIRHGHIQVHRMLVMLEKVTQRNVLPVQTREMNERRHIECFRADGIEQQLDEIGIILHNTVR